MSLRFSLDHFLQENNLSAYRLAKETAGDVARASVYAMARGDRVKRVDLSNLWHILNALNVLTEREVGIQDLFELELDQDRSLRRSGSGVPFTGDVETDDILDEHPEAVERYKRHLEGAHETYDLEDVAKTGVEET